jgi:hypothetical protein
MKGGLFTMLTAEVFWKMFEATGSIVAYLMYRSLIIQ